jgi:hypothetical protein
MEKGKEEINLRNVFHYFFKAIGSGFQQVDLG